MEATPSSETSALGVTTQEDYRLNSIRRKSLHRISSLCMNRAGICVIQRHCKFSILYSLGNGLTCEYEALIEWSCQKQSGVICGNPVPLPIFPQSGLRYVRPYAQASTRSYVSNLTLSTMLVP